MNFKGLTHGIQTPSHPLPPTCLVSLVLTYVYARDTKQFNASKCKRGYKVTFPFGYLRSVELIIADTLTILLTHGNIKPHEYSYSFI